MFAHRAERSASAILLALIRSWYIGSFVAKSTPDHWRRRLPGLAHLALFILRVEMLRHYSCVLIAVAFVQSPSHACADLFSVTGTWSYTIDGQGFAPPQVFSGSASFTYDDTAVPANGFFVLKPLPLQSFSQTPQTIGTTTFDLSNTFASVAFDDGALFQTIVGGFDPDRIFGGDDDFSVSSFGNADLSVATEMFIASASQASVSFVHTAIPEPSAISCLALFGLGLVGWKTLTRVRTT